MRIAQLNAATTSRSMASHAPPRAAARWWCCGLALAALGAAPAPDATPVAADVEPARPPLPALATSPWPELAAVLPGVLIHGSGTWLQGRAVTTQRLLLLEGASLFAILLGGLVIYETGAARDVVGAASMTAAAGVGGLSASFLANLYATWAPAPGWGDARRRLPRLISSLGYTYVGDAQFSDHHLMTARVDGRLDAWHLQLDSAISPAPGHEQLSASAGYRWFGPRAAREPARDGSYLEPLIGAASQRFDRYGFVTRTLQVQLEGRLDVQRWLPDVHGGFFQASIGLARQWIEFDVPGASATDTSELLLLHSGFGVYVGGRSAAPRQDPASAPGGELELYYDHRRDGLAGGMKTTGPSSGFAGHVGLRGEYYVTEAWGSSATVEVGSTWVLGCRLVFRAGLP